MNVTRYFIDKEFQSKNETAYPSTNNQDSSVFPTNIHLTLDDKILNKAVKAAQKKKTHHSLYQSQDYGISAKYNMATN